MSKFCPNCGKEYEGEPNFCPSCGEKFNQNIEENPQKNTETKKQPASMPKGCSCLLSIIVFIVIFNMLFSGGIKNVMSGNNDDLKLLNYRACNGEFGARMVCGTIVNNSDRTMGYAQVEINLYDKSGSLVGSTMSNINNLEPKKKWKFEAPIMEENVTRFEIKDINGF